MPVSNGRDGYMTFTVAQRPQGVNRFLGMSRVRQRVVWSW